MPGVKNVPNASPPQTTSTASVKRSSGHGRRAATTIETISPTMIGRSGPARSATCPITMLLPASSAAEQRKTAPMPTAPSPSAESRSGASTESAPNRSAGRATNQPAASTRRSAIVRSSAAASCARSFAGAGTIAAQPTSPNDATATAPNVQPMPATDATPPITGPKSAPKTAAANARPIRAPRRSGGDDATSHPSAPVHENALAIPCAKRAASSSHAWSRRRTRRCRRRRAPCRSSSRA